MKNRLLTIVKENTKNGNYRENNATELGKVLGSSRNWISQFLNEYYNNGTFIKINTRPVVFLDKSTLEDAYHMKMDQNLLSSYEELNEIINHHNKHDFQKLIGYKGSLRTVVDKCKASISYPPHGLLTLLHGETGTGKSTIVKLMYEYGVNNDILKKDSKFLHVNCSEYANNPELITANLFGYKKGAFTGADNDNIGLIKAADGGVLFLDEVHCLKPECQEKLFLFMDNGSYRMLGDNEHVYHSDVLLVFATTEKPEDVLLKTLLRRIPIRIEIPSLEERGIKEKSRILVEAFVRESEKMKKDIHISNTAYNALLNAKYSGNIGEFFNVVQATCMNALFHNSKEDYVEIHTINLPESIIANSRFDRNTLMFDRHQMFSLHDLKEKVVERPVHLHLYQKLLSHLQDLQNNRIMMEDFISFCTKDVQHYFNSELFDGTFVKNPSSTYLLNAMKTIVEMISERYGYTFQVNEIYSMSMLVRDCLIKHMEIEGFLTSNAEECECFYRLIEKKFSREFSIVSEIKEVLQVRMDVTLDPFVMAVFTLIMHMYHGDKDINRRIGVIIAHGFATASSIANAVNQLLDQYIFDAIDMPLEISTEAIINKLNDFLKKCCDFKELVLLVDMGSLEEIYTGLTNVSKANIAIANNVNTSLALMVGEGIRNEVPTNVIFDECKQKLDMRFKIIEREEKEKVILCSCATGIGTAEKLKDILEDSLPKNLPVKVLTYDYSTLIQTRLEDAFFQNYEVICIVGTLNPNIDNTIFIPLEELIMNNSFDILTVHFKDLINDEDMEVFHKNILKNFSLSNIIGNLTILNPDKLLEHVADAIDRLQNEMNSSFSNNVCFGLYVHICCLIERLVTRQGIEEYKKAFDECDEDAQKFITNIKKSFAKVERYYHVDIPIEEIEYIHIYIENMC